jgi:hypothetical protein
VYRVHEKGAAPRDVLIVDEIPPVLEGGVLKCATLAGGSGQERVIAPNGEKHPTQKPLKLTRWLILGSSNPGDNVLIPFSGSGTEALVAYEEKRRFIGFELNGNYVEMSRARFEAAGFATERCQLGETRAWRAVGRGGCSIEDAVHQDSKCRAEQSVPTPNFQDREPADRDASPCSRTAVGCGAPKPKTYSRPGSLKIDGGGMEACQITAPKLSMR